MRRHAETAPTAVALVAFLAACLCATVCSASPRYEDDGKGLAGLGLGEREVASWRDMTLQMLQQMLRANGDLGPIYNRKRNSEIINSLLGLPKTMTEAGRK